MEATPLRVMRFPPFRGLGMPHGLDPGVGPVLVEGFLDPLDHLGHGLLCGLEVKFGLYHAIAPLGGHTYMTSAVGGVGGSLKSRQKERGCVNSVRERGAKKNPIFCGRL